MRNLIPALCLAFMFSGPAWGQDPVPEAKDPELSFWMGARVGSWHLRIEGYAELSEVFGMEFEPQEDRPRLDFGDEGGIDGREGIVTFEVWGGGWSEEKAAAIRFVFWKGSWRGSGSTPGEIDLKLQSIPAGTPFESRLDVGYASLDFVATAAEGNFRGELSAGLGALWYRFEMKTPLGELEDGAGGGPFVLGFRGDWRPIPEAYLSAGLRLTVMDYGFFDAFVAGGAEIGAVRAEAGYRRVWSHYIGGDNLKLAGGFVSLRVDF
jgi:hypothetical protein